MSMRLDDEELDRLAGHGASAVSHAAKLAYILGIRPFMDYETGLVGYRRRVSYQSLRELLEVAPVPGSHREERLFNLEAIRGLLRELERAGLIRWIRSRERGLFFECLVAHRGIPSKNRNNMGATSRSHISATMMKPSQDAGLGDVPAHEEQHGNNIEEQHTSGYPVEEERERDARARASEPGLPACIPAQAWRMYEDERNMATGRLMSINQRLALWQQLVTLDSEGYDPEAVLLHCVAHGLARFERRPELRRRTGGQDHGHAGHADTDNSAVAKVRRRAEQRERERQGNVIDLAFKRETS